MTQPPGAEARDGNVRIVEESAPRAGRAAASPPPLDRDNSRCLSNVRVILVLGLAAPSGQRPLRRPCRLHPKPYFHPSRRGLHHPRLVRESLLAPRSRESLPAHFPWCVN